MQNGDEWQQFVKHLFRSQYTRKSFAPDDPISPSSQTPDASSGERPRTLSHVLYDESQGITDLAVKLYMFAQERAIESKKETVNESIVRSVARDKFKTLKDVLRAIREGNERSLSNWDDVYPAVFRKYVKPQTNGSPGVTVKGHLASDPTIQASLNKTSEPLTTSQQSLSEAEKTDDGPKTGTSPSTSANEKKKRHRKEQQGVLPNLIAKVDKKVDTAAYDALKSAGYVGIQNPLV